jgi:hypothetical protein
MKSLIFLVIDTFESGRAFGKLNSILKREKAEGGRQKAEGRSEKAEVRGRIANGGESLAAPGGV